MRWTGFAMRASRRRPLTSAYETLPARHDAADWRQQALRELLSDVYPYYLTYPILERYSLIRRQLRPPHGPGLIGDIDTLIAATAIERNLTVITCDTDYERVPDLKTLVIPRSEFRR
jgi:predicted nucleic acid-binding protein